MIGDVPFEDHDRLLAADAVLIAATLLSFLPPQSDERKQLTTTVATAT